MTYDVWNGGFVDWPSVPWRRYVHPPTYLPTPHQPTHPPTKNRSAIDFITELYGTRTSSSSSISRPASPNEPSPPPPPPLPSSPSSTRSSSAASYKQQHKNQPKLFAPGVVKACTSLPIHPPQPNRPMHHSSSFQPPVSRLSTHPPTHLFPYTVDITIGSTIEEALELFVVPVPGIPSTHWWWWGSCQVVHHHC